MTIASKKDIPADKYPIMQRKVRTKYILASDFAVSVCLGVNFESECLFLIQLDTTSFHPLQ